MKTEVYDTLRVRAKQALLAERMKTAVDLQIDRMGKWGTVPDIALLPMEEARALLRRSANSLKREGRQICVGEPLYEFVENTVGLSNAVFMFVGCLPPFTAFANVSKLWKYTGLYVTPAGKAPTGADLAALKKENPDAGWSPEMRAHAIKRLAEPCMKNRESPYRGVYDQRKQRTLFTHPPMLEEGAGCEFCDACYEKRRKTKKTGLDCANLGGHHWKDGHRHNDALRVTAKAILLDLWLIENGMPAVLGGQSGLDTHKHDAPSADTG